MATVHTTTLIDDLNGDPAQETVAFGIDGTQYEIDLSTAHAQLLRDRLARFVDAARPGPASAPPAQRRRSRRNVASRTTPGQIRAWAAEQGITVSSRGRISADIVEQYHAAQH